MSTRRPGRPSKYDWDDKRDVCYKLYVQEQKPIKDIIGYFQQVYGTDASIPNARDFSRQFGRWHFPRRKQNLNSDDEARLLQRVRELFDANNDQQQMLEVLTGEGWQLDPAYLARFRRKHGLMLRLAKGYDREHMGAGTGKKRKLAETSTLEATDAVVPRIATEEAARRAQRLVTLQGESDAALGSHKRRRRIRGWANLPPDAAGTAPRYKSETSLDECKAFLNLSNELYKEIRQSFESICNEMGIIKKRLCSDGEWTAAKHRLIKEHIPLSAALNPVHENIADRDNAFEVICSDVTKRMRHQKTRHTVKSANNMLGLNPETSKELRRQFYDILKADHFETKLLCGNEHWEELKNQWRDSSELVQQLYQTVGADIEKRKCVEVLLRDAMKRHHDNNVAKLLHLTQQSNTVGPGPARAAALSTLRAQITAPIIRPQINLDIDPALYTALSTELGTSATITIPAYFRLSQLSTIDHSKMWLASLSSPDMQALRAAALSKSPTAHLVTISGLLKNSDGREEAYRIDNDEELQVYLETVREMAGGKATFLVELQY